MLTIVRCHDSLSVGAYNGHHEQAPASTPRGTHACVSDGDTPLGRHASVRPQTRPVSRQTLALPLHGQLPT